MATKAPSLHVFQSQLNLCGVSVCTPSFPVRPEQEGPDLTNALLATQQTLQTTSHLISPTPLTFCQFLHPASHHAICSWSSPFLSSLCMDSPTHSPYGEKLLVFHRVSSLPLSPSHFPWTFLSRHVPSPVT